MPEDLCTAHVIGARTYGVRNQLDTLMMFGKVLSCWNWCMRIRNRSGFRRSLSDKSLARAFRSTYLRDGVCIVTM